MNRPDIAEVARRVPSKLFQGARELFVAQHGTFSYARGGTRYVADENNPNNAGEILIDPDELESKLPFYQAPAVVVETLLSHELGHYMYAKQTRATAPRSGASVDAAADWRHMRQAQASLFAYRVAKELKAKGHPAYVTAPTGTMDIYDAMAQAERGGRNVLMLAKTVFAADPTYTLFCRGHITRSGQAVQVLPPVRIVGKRPSSSSAARR